MTERSIAEIIGCGHIVRTLPNVKGQAIRERWIADPYAADDLLAWLREQDVWVRPQSDDLTDVPVRLSVYRALWPEHQDHSIDETVSAPTLLGALEAAVRAVAGQEGP